MRRALDKAVERAEIRKRRDRGRRAWWKQWKPNWPKLASLVISGVSGGGGDGGGGDGGVGGGGGVGFTWLHFLGKEGRKEGVYSRPIYMILWMAFSGCRFV